MVTQIKKPDGEKVTEAKATQDGLLLHIGDFWPAVDTKDKFLDDGAVILLDTAESNQHFNDAYVARYSGDPADSATPQDINGGTTDPVAVCLTEQWLAGARAIFGGEVVLPVPTPDKAGELLPKLRAERQSAVV